MITPINDGIDHINIYSQSKTVLGRFLSNFAHQQITIGDGSFESIEGYWYWLSNRNKLMRTLYGFKAKTVGKSLARKITLNKEEFQQKIIEACWIKLSTNQNMYHMFSNSTLPFTHYYVYGDKIIDQGDKFKWLLDMWENFRVHIKSNPKQPNDVKYYTGVGSRSTPKNILQLMTAIARKMEFMGIVLRSGGAKGADTAFEIGASRLKEIFYANDSTYEAEVIASKFHPAWDKCNPYVRKLHGRNAFQVLGKELNMPSQYCICWTPDGATTHIERCFRTGGTGTAISIADRYRIPVVNLAIPSHRKMWDDWSINI